MCARGRPSQTASDPSAAIDAHVQVAWRYIAAYPATGGVTGNVVMVHRLDSSNADGQLQIVGVNTHIPDGISNVFTAAQTTAGGSFATLSGDRRRASDAVEQVAPGDARVSGGNRWASRSSSANAGDGPRPYSGATSVVAGSRHRDDGSARWMSSGMRRATVAYR
jgi:hypothetical protein